MIPLLDHAVAEPLIGVAPSLVEPDPTNFGLAFGTIAVMFCLLMCGQSAVGYVRARRRQTRLLDQLSR
ncbi:hypothetical protein [Haloprofundus salilacus]|uniref:hypothetical protein n=1 Tax=Haloprofundus salilacus TaxID=2876190 RepID=UPI001CCD3D00|nr:hypothetical protein [Haloprofundus salilacus]